MEEITEVKWKELVKGEEREREGKREREKRDVWEI